MNNKTKFLKLGIAVLLGAGTAGVLYAQLNIPTNIENSVMTIKQINITPDGQASAPRMVIDGSAPDGNFLKVEGSILMGSITGSNFLNKVSGSKSSVLGGMKNAINGNYSIIPGGSFNSLTGNNSFAFGNEVRVNGSQSYGIGKSLILNGDNSFLFSDGTTSNFTASKNNIFIVNAINGVGINTGVTTTGYALTVQGSGIVYGNLRANNMVAGAYYYGSITNDQEAYELKLSQWEGTTGDIYYNSGYVGVGTPTPTAQFHNNGTVRLQGLSTSTQATALVVDTNGNVGRRTLNTIAFNGVTESDPTVNTLAKATLSCTNGQVAKFNGTAWTCAADAGLTSETDPTVNALAKTALSCTNGQVAKFNGTAWTCAADAGLTSETDPTVNTLAKATLSCTNGQVAKFNGTAWTCAADAGLTSYTETDPQVGSLTNGRWCTTDGTTVNCTTVAPITSESDPTVNALAKTSLSCSTNQIVKWNGSVRACASDGGLTSESDPTAVKLTTNQTVAGVKTFSSNGIFNANVGIGIATPSEKLDVNGNVKATKIIASGAPNTSYNINAGDIGANSLYGYDAVCTNNSYGNCQGAGGVVIGRANASSVINIPTNGNVFFNNGGNVGIGTTSPANKLHVAGAIGATDWIGAGCEGACESGGGYAILYANGTIVATSHVTASAFYYSSDKSLKKDLKQITNPIEKIIALNGYYFTWKKDNTKDIGLVAQEVEKVFPDAVKTDDKGLKSVKYGNLVAPIIEAIKELYANYLDQQEKISDLESRIIMLENKLNNK